MCRLTDSGDDSYVPGSCKFIIGADSTTNDSLEKFEQLESLAGQGHSLSHNVTKGGDNLVTDKDDSRRQINASSNGRNMDQSSSNNNNLDEIDSVGIKGMNFSEKVSVLKEEQSNNTRKTNLSNSNNTSLNRSIKRLNDSGDTSLINNKENVDVSNQSESKNNTKPFKQNSFEENENLKNRSEIAQSKSGDSLEKVKDEGEIVFDLEKSFEGQNDSGNDSGRKSLDEKMKSADISNEENSSNKESKNVNARLEDSNNAKIVEKSALSVSRTSEEKKVEISTSEDLLASKMKSCDLSDLSTSEDEGHGDSSGLGVTADISGNVDESPDLKSTNQSVVSPGSFLRNLEKSYLAKFVSGRWILCFINVTIV